MDRGDGCPLLLPVPPSESASITLQTMLDDWQSQAMVHGFESAPMSVVLQIGRFIQVDAAWTKSTRRVLIPDTCSLPVFTDGLNLEHISSGLGSSTWVTLRERGTTAPF